MECEEDKFKCTMYLYLDLKIKSHPIYFRFASFQLSFGVRKVCILWSLIIDPSSLAVLNFIIIIDHGEIVVGGGAVV